MFHDINEKFREYWAISWLIRIFKGIVIAGFILPGVSGGVLALFEDLRADDLFWRI